MRFLVDENLPAEAALALVAAGHEATSVHALQLGGVSDAMVAQVARQQDRTLLTLDTDFANLPAYPPEQTEGIIVLRLERQDKASVLGVVSLLVEALRHASPRGQLWIVDERRIRIRGGLGGAGGT